MRRARIKAVANVPARRKVEENKTVKTDENKTEKVDENKTAKPDENKTVKTDENETTNENTKPEEIKVPETIAESNPPLPEVVQEVAEKPRSRIRAVAKIPIRRNKTVEKADTTDDVTTNESNFVKPDENENTTPAVVVRPSPVTSPIVQQPPHRPRIRSIPRLDGHSRGAAVLGDRRNSTSASESEDEYSRRNIRNRLDSTNSNSNTSNVVSDNHIPLNTLATINTSTINNCNNTININAGSAAVKEVCTKVDEEIHKNVLSPHKNNVSNKESVVLLPGGPLSPQSNTQQIQSQQQQQPIIKRKVRRSDIAKKMAEAKRDFYNKFGTKTPDRQKLTMMDLIFYNPTTNPMLNKTKTPTSSSAASVTSSTRKKNNEQQMGSSSSVASFNDNESVHSMSTRADEEMVDEPEEEAMQPVPQVKIGENGEIILDEQSVIIETNDQQIQRMNKSRELTETAINYDELNTTYGIYKRAKRTKDWSAHETKQFYRVLQMIGTDFSMMLSYFKNRTRRDLKLKFKKEEKINRHLIDKVLLNPCTFDLQQLQQSLDQDQQLLQEQQLNQQQIQEIKRQDQLLRKRKSHEKRVRYKTGSWLARQMYIEKNDMIQAYDDDDPPPVVPTEGEPPSREEENSTTAEIETPMLIENEKPTVEVDHQNLKVEDQQNPKIEKDHNSKGVTGDGPPPAKKNKYTYEDVQDDSEDDETSQLVTAMFGKQTTTRCGRKIRSRIMMKNKNVVPERGGGDEFIIPHPQEDIIIPKNQEERIPPSDNQDQRIAAAPEKPEEIIISNNQEESIIPDEQQEQKILHSPSEEETNISDKQEEERTEQMIPEEEIIVPDNQEEMIVSNNQDINFEEVLYQNNQDHLEENIRKLMAETDEVEEEEDNDDDVDDGNGSEESQLVIDLNPDDDDEINNKQLINNNSKLNELLEDYLGNNQTITLELPVVMTDDNTEQFKVIIELTNQSDDDGVEVD